MAEARLTKQILMATSSSGRHTRCIYSICTSTRMSCGTAAVYTVALAAHRCRELLQTAWSPSLRCCDQKMATTRFQMMHVPDNPGVEFP